MVRFLRKYCPEGTDFHVASTWNYITQTTDSCVGSLELS